MFFHKRFLVSLAGKISSLMQNFKVQKNLLVLSDLIHVNWVRLPAAKTFQ